MLEVCLTIQHFHRYGFSYFDEDNQSNETMEKEKSKKCRTLYNITEYSEDLEDDNSLGKGNGNGNGNLFL